MMQEDDRFNQAKKPPPLDELYSLDFSFEKAIEDRAVMEIARVPDYAPQMAA